MKRAILTVLALLTLLVGPAQALDTSTLDLSKTEPAMRTVLLKAMVGVRLKVRMHGDVVLVGTLRGVGEGDVVFHVEGEKDARSMAFDGFLSVERFAKKLPKAQKPVPRKGIASRIQHAVDSGGIWRVTLKSMKTYVGRVAKGANSARIAIHVDADVIVQVLSKNVGSVVKAGRSVNERKNRRRSTRKKRSSGSDVYSPDPNATRYLFAPSAMMLKKGDGYFSQKQLGFSEVAYGVTDNFSVVFGGVLPAWLIAPPAGFNLAIGGKLGFELVKDLHWAAGVYGLVIPAFGGDSLLGGGFVFTTLTGGSKDYHGSISVGFPFLFNEDEAFLDPVIVATANLRVSAKLALVSENWIFPAILEESEEAGMLNTLALRFIADSFAVDVGLIHVLGMPEDVALLPWLDFTYNWSSGN